MEEEERDLGPPRHLRALALCEARAAELGHHRPHRGVVPHRRAQRVDARPAPVLLPDLRPPPSAPTHSCAAALQAQVRVRVRVR